MHNYHQINNPHSRNVVLKMIQVCHLVDVYGVYIIILSLYIHFIQKTPFLQARLDYLIGSRTLIKLVGNCDILLAYRTNHFLIILEVLINIFKHDKGV